jgi:hypothetical protein
MRNAAARQTRLPCLSGDKGQDCQTCFLAQHRRKTNQPLVTAKFGTPQGVIKTHDTPHVKV